MPLLPDTSVVASSDLAVADLGDEAVLLDPTSGNYFGLNEVGARILSIASKRTTVREIIDLLLDEYDVEREQLSADVTEFLEDLERRGLVDVA